MRSYLLVFIGSPYFDFFYLYRLSNVARVCESFVWLFSLCFKRQRKIREMLDIIGESSREPLETLEKKREGWRTRGGGWNSNTVRSFFSREQQFINNWAESGKKWITRPCTIRGVALQWNEQETRETVKPERAKKPRPTARNISPVNVAIGEFYVVRSPYIMNECRPCRYCQPRVFPVVDSEMGNENKQQIWGKKEKTPILDIILIRKLIIKG